MSRPKTSLFILPLFSTAKHSCTRSSAPRLIPQARASKQHVRSSHAIEIEGHSLRRAVPPMCLIIARISSGQTSTCLPNACHGKHDA
jgi:hypothetical protein